MEKYIEKLSEQLPDEILGYRKYKMLAEQTDNLEEKQKLLEIANQEHNHYEIIKNILEKYIM